jgi:hypothetical protein
VVNTGAVIRKKVPRLPRMGSWNRSTPNRAMAVPARITRVIDDLGKRIWKGVRG